MAVRVAVCGPLTVVRDGDELAGPRLGSRKARVLLAVLAAGRRAPVSTERLVEAVWEGRPPLDPDANVATLVSRLRKAVGDGVLVPGPASYALGSAVVLDLDEVGELMGAAHTRLTRREPALAVSAALRALALLGDDLGLAEEYAGDWADPLRREVADARREARHLLADAATVTGQHELAHTAAAAAADADPYDERARRDQMVALARGGRSTAALDVYAALVARLGDELGTDPDAETQRLHVAILRGEDVGEAPAATGTRRTAALVGREDELHLLDAAWAAASAGEAGLVLVAGVPGIGKTRLLREAAALAARSGGLVLTTRCRPAERSLFLQPFVEVLRPVLLGEPEPMLRTLLGAHAAAWTQLLPELEGLLGPVATTEVSPVLARRRSFDAVVAVLAALAARGPVMLAVDDLQYGAESTAELVAHAATHLGGSPVLLVAAVRTEALPTLGGLTELATPVVLGPLPASAVGALATAAGFGSRADEVQARSHGHPLSVVASLQAMSGGTTGVPEDLATAVAAQLSLLDDGVARLVGAASVLGTRVAPRVLEGLVGQAEVEAVLGCERLVRAGLLVATGPGYEFTNDLVQEAVLATLGPPLAIAYHRRAADLLGDRPEEMAGHAHAAGEPGRAARGYLQAGRTARRSGSVDDALVLLELGFVDAEASVDDGVAAAVLLERARAREARTEYAVAEADMLLAQARASAAGDPRLELRALRMLGGDNSVALRRPHAGMIATNRAGAALAAELGDAVAEAMFRSRLVVLDSSRLLLTNALRLATTTVQDARGAAFPEAVARSLDGLKNVHAQLGDVASLQPVIDELLPLLSGRRLTWLLQWALVESSLVPAGTGDWAEARRRVDQALEVNRTTGYAAYAGFFRAQRAWLARLAGELDASLADSRRALAETTLVDHPWFIASAAGTYASTLLDLGRVDEAAEVSRTGLAALGDEAGAAYRLRCLAPLAAATGEGLEEADRLVAAIRTPPGTAWISGADAYDAVAAGWLAAGEPERAAVVLAPLLAATGPTWAGIHARARQRTSPTSAAARSAPPSGTGR